jgi:ComF family protein
MTHYKNDVIKKLIKSFKFYWKKDIWEELWEKLWKFVKTNNFLEEFNNGFVLPVPLHFFKKIKRWFNQSEILAENFSKVLNFNYKKNLLIRKKYTRQQSKLSRQERLNNLNNSFKINKNQGDKVDNKIVFLIDDVVTSWTTLNEIAKVLKQNWAKKVVWVCIASN